MSREFELFWKPFTRVFQTLGVSHYTIFRPEIYNNRLKSVALLLYYIILIAFHVLLLMITTYKGRCYESEKCEARYKGSPLMYYVNGLSVFGSIATHLSVHFENIFYGNQEDEICEKFKNIYGIFASRLNYRLNYKAKRVKYVRIVGFYTFAIILSCTTAFSKLPDQYNDMFFMTPMMIFGVIITRARWLQISLFLNILSDTLEDLQSLLRQQQIRSSEETNEPSENRYTCQNIRYFRAIYSNIWLIVTMMSDYFGWSLIAFLVKVTLEFINGSYWLYVNWHMTQMSTALIFRKICYK